MSAYPNWENMSWEKREKEIFEKPENLKLWRKLREPRLRELVNLIQDILYDKTPPTEKLDKLYEIDHEHSFWSVHNWSSEARQLQQAISNVHYLKQISSRGLEPTVRKET